MKISNFDKTHAVRVYRGSVNPRRAAPMLPRISDGTNDVDNASEIVFDGGLVTEPEDGVAHVNLGGGGTGSAAAPTIVRNNSGRGLVLGDVVVTDSTMDRAVTVTTDEGSILIPGVVQDIIPDGSLGPVLFAGSGGYSALINIDGAADRGDYVKTSSVETAALATATREAGTFGVLMTGTDFPDFVTSSAVTTSDIPVDSLTITMPAIVPVDRVLFLQLQLDSAAANPDIPGWTLIGSTDPFYYYQRISAGADFAVATWTNPSVAVAVVLLLHQAVSLAVPVEDFDYDSTTSAASLSGLSDVSRFAVAGVDADVATPGSGFVRLAGGTADFLAGGTPSLIQSAYGSEFSSYPTLGAAVTVGNVVVAVPFAVNHTTTWSTDPRQGGTCPPDTNMVDMSDAYTDLTDQACLQIAAKVAADTYPGIYGTQSGCDSSWGSLALLEFENVGVADFQHNEQTGGAGTSVDLGTFTVGADDVTVMAYISRNNPGSVSGLNGFTQIVYDAGFACFLWVGYKIGDGDASITLASDPGVWAAGAVVLTGGGSHAEGTLAGMYIGHDAAVTSPFTGGSQQNDALFAFNLLQDAKPSVLLYGPDLGAAIAGSISIVDAGGYFTGTDVEAVLQELASKDIGYQSHGSMGSTETFSALTGWHSGTFNADCTFTFSGAISGLVASMVLELTEDGTGGWQPTWPGSVVWPGGSAPTHDDTAGTTTIYLFESRDGGTTWYGFQAGGGTSIAFGTPAIVLGTAAAAGSIDEVIRRDSTIVAFDATVPVTQAFSDAAATGAAAVAARRDHVHGMPASPTGTTDHAHVAYETHTSDGAATTFTLDNYFESGTVIAQNSTTGHNLRVTAETLPDQVTISAAGTAGDLLDFHYAASVI